MAARWRKHRRVHDGGASATEPPPAEAGDAASIDLREVPAVADEGGGRPSAASVPTAMVVDDDRDVRESLQLSLSLEGWEVLVAEDGERALACLRSVEPDVVILDHQMPGMSGLECAEAIKAMGSAAQVLMFSALIDAATVEAARELGVLPISKVDRGSLFRLLKVLMQQATEARYRV